MNAADRFTKKNLTLNYNTLDALSNYFENGGTITVCKPGRRTRANTSFKMVKGSISHIGSQSNKLKNAGQKNKRG